ncbi:hypothetical protein DUI87_18606 [Hirundo rustica rustica]|uniref:Uncharacterized protein n=1 Tax=Hirundo rustica rustica TaxID=333673 RepID=A0A3M0JXA4_HIRRU|nr:hypothetical protein DUI87_18606 [Hirundo rustica rustica]
MIGEFTVCLWQEEITHVGNGVLKNSYLFNAETSAAMLDLLVEKGVSNPKQVPAMVKYIHRWLTANESAEHRLDKPLVKLTKEHPSDVLITLLRWAPSCDRLEREKQLSISSLSPENEGRVYCTSIEVKIVLVYNCQYSREGLTSGSC